jgi:hypothetical protein
MAPRHEIGEQRDSEGCVAVRGVEDHSFREEAGTLQRNALYLHV